MLSAGVSPVAVLRGVWAFFKNANLDGKYPPLLGPKFLVDGVAHPGLYPFATNVGITNDDNVVPSAGAGRATIAGISEPEGQHKHVFTLEGNLNAADDNFFNDRVSSIVVQQAVWAFFPNAGFNAQYPRTLGPGLYSFVVDFGIQNDDLSSLQPVGNRWGRRGRCGDVSCLRLRFF